MKNRNLKTRTQIFFTILAGIALSTTTLYGQASADDIYKIIKGYSEDYEKDPSLTRDVTFGVAVEDEFWQITARAKTEVDSAKVTLSKGKPEAPVFFFKTDFNTLKKIEQGELNALTASAKEFSSDEAPFDVDFMEGFVPDKYFTQTLFSVYFHFWTKGVPERIPFGLDHTRYTHGAQASVFYYQKGFRSAYFALKKGQHANKNEKSKTNPFPSLFIPIRGEGVMIINGKRSISKAGEAIFIQAGVAHEFLNENDLLFEGILLMFGEGA